MLAKLAQEYVGQAVSNPLRDASSLQAVGHAVFTPEQRMLLQMGINKRRSARGPAALCMHVLIVESQEFSRKLLAALFTKRHCCHTAKNAKEAIALYAEHVPDIVFLDIELPDIYGHALATLFKKHDPESYIVMVTGNHCPRDREIAEANRVQGYIMKPYSRLKIMDAVNAFIMARKRG